MKTAVCVLLLLYAAQTYAQNDFPGGYIDLKLDKVNDKLPEIKFGLREPAIIDKQSHWQVLIGLDLKLLPGQYVLYVKHEDDNASGEHKTIEVRQKVYPFQDLSEDDSVNSVDFYPQPEISQIVFSNTQQPFLPLTTPLQGDWNRQFGYQWILEDDVVTNNAISIVARQYSPVVAPQNAIISNIIMDQRELATVVLDHGRGLYSILRGLTDLTVDIGNGVVSGAVLGRLPASSEDAQGKLVWQVLLNGVFIDPKLLTKPQKPSEKKE